MVLEAIISPKNARRHPWKIAALAFVFVSIGVIGAEFLGIYKSLMVILLTVIPGVPFLWRLFDYEENEMEQNVVLGSRTIARHFPVILTMSLFFVGLVAAFVFWYIALPDPTVSQLFEVQVNELKSIGAATGQVIFSSANDKLLQVFESLFFHNLGVLVLIVLFSLLYGAGAVFVFVWNASVIGTFIGSYAKSVSGGSTVSLISNVSVGALGLLPHGSFELLAYLIAALAGGILSSSITREIHKTNAFSLVLHDSTKLAAISIIFLAIGALIEAGAIAG